MDPQGNEKQQFECPMFVARSSHGLPRTCNNFSTKKMSEVRRHLTRSSAGYPPELAFLRLCPTCNEDIIDKAEFEDHHGYRGQLCNNRRSQRRGDGAMIQWDSLYQKLQARLIAQTQIGPNMNMIHSQDLPNSIPEANTAQDSSRTPTSPEPRSTPTPPNLSNPSSGLPEAIPCTYTGCAASYTGKYRDRNLKRHLRLKHTQKQGQEKEYTRKSCRKTYTRSDAMLKHYRNRHSPADATHCTGPAKQAAALP
ncbi:hypothetical protein GQ44DRAFT_734017 [Phaeosphaeriaceae sp. PMI808]|nr:hypothetical protein GQ44DRAFT_734017 [Phaeosphaeriaceae sp. PMI808]